jgi:hypothetical protein
MECGSGCAVLPPGAFHWQPIQLNWIKTACETHHGHRKVGKECSSLKNGGRCSGM